MQHISLYISIWRRSGRTWHKTIQLPLVSLSFSNKTFGFVSSGERGESGFSGAPGLKGFSGDPGYYGGKGPKGFRGTGLSTRKKAILCFIPRSHLWRGRWPIRKGDLWFLTVSLFISTSSATSILSTSGPPGRKGLPGITLPNADYRIPFGDQGGPGANGAPGDVGEPGQPGLPGGSGELFHGVIVQRILSLGHKAFGGFKSSILKWSPCSCSSSVCDVFLRQVLRVVPVVRVSWEGWAPLVCLDLWETPDPLVSPEPLENKVSSLSSRLYLHLPLLFRLFSQRPARDGLVWHDL